MLPARGLLTNLSVANLSERYGTEVTITLIVNEGNFDSWQSLWHDMHGRSNIEVDLVPVRRTPTRPIQDSFLRAKAMSEVQSKLESKGGFLPTSAEAGDW